MEVSVLAASQRPEPLLPEASAALALLRLRPEASAALPLADLAISEASVDLAGLATLPLLVLLRPRRLASASVSLLPRRSVLFLLRRVALVPVSFRHRRLTSVLRKPRSRTDSPVADAKADTKADARIANAALLLVAASMPDSVDLLLRVVSAALDHREHSASKF